MVGWRHLVVCAVAVLGCKKAGDSEQKSTPTGSAQPQSPVAVDAAAAAVEPSWYRAVVKAPDGIEAVFFIGLPGGSGPQKATYKIGRYEMKNDMTFDGKKLSITIPVMEASVEATETAPGTLTGTFTTAWRTWGPGTLPLTATKVAAPTPATLATVDMTAGALDLGEPRTVWKLAMPDAGTVKLTVDQTEPGSFDAMMELDSGNLIYLAGNGSGNALVMTGFDGTSVYRLDLELDKARKAAKGKFAGGHKFDWRETVTAARTSDFVVKLKAKAKVAKGKLELPKEPGLEAVKPGPLLVEISGAWCSTCRYAAPVLVELYKEYQPRGLQAVTLLYEFTDDPAFDKIRADAFKQAYNVTWPVVSVSGTIEDLFDTLPTNLSDVDVSGLPIALFINADRTLAAIHAGFPSPDAKDAHEKVIAEFRANIEKILATAPKP
jgi:thiol-disulfide isomerase/thioredoxin